MGDISLWLVVLIWLVGTCLRIYRQARFYQIEEYMSRRFLRWVFAERERWMPARPLAVRVVGSGIGLTLNEAPGNFVPVVVAILTSIIAVWPPREIEVKKGFKATARAKRLLSASFALATICAIIGVLITNALPLDIIESLPLVVVGLGGMGLFLLAPFFLIAGNLLMTPVEALFRRQFIRRAEAALAEVNPIVIGITGSYGKTSTKAYLTHILNGRYHAYATPKSYNTLMGICLAINNDLAHDHSIDYFIVEMGAYIPGEIERICWLTRPHISVVVEVGPQHLERFGTLENIAIAKYEIIRALPPDGLGVFNWDNPYVRAMAEKGYPAKRITVSKENSQPTPQTGREEDGFAESQNQPRFVASDISESLAGLRFTVTDSQTGDSEVFNPPLLGQHNVTNVLLAAAVAVHEGMSLKDVARRVSALQPAESRLVSQTSAEGITIINDAYSANPVGAESSLRVLGMHQSGRRLLITPGMVELGSLMEAENRKLGETAAQYATEVILVGAKQTEPIKAGLLAAGFPPEHVQVVETLAESVEWYQNNLKPGDTVLFLNDLPDTYSS